MHDEAARFASKPNKAKEPKMETSGLHLFLD